MATSRDLTLIDALVDAIDTAWNPSSPDSVERQYLANISEKDLKDFIGRKVILFPLEYETEDANRSENQYGYGVGVEVLERFEDAGKATDLAVKEWLDERLDFVETQLIDALDYGGGGLLAIGSRRLWTESIETPARYDIELLAEKKIFRCSLKFKFRELA